MGKEETGKKSGHKEGRIRAEWEAGAGLLLVRRGWTEPQVLVSFTGNKCIFSGLSAKWLPSQDCMVLTPVSQSDTRRPDVCTYQV